MGSGVLLDPGREGVWGRGLERIEVQKWRLHFVTNFHTNCMTSVQSSYRVDAFRLIGLGCNLRGPLRAVLKPPALHHPTPEAKATSVPYVPFAGHACGVLSGDVLASSGLRVRDFMTPKPEPAPAKCARFSFWSLGSEVQPPGF